MGLVLGEYVQGIFVLHMSSCKVPIHFKMCLVLAWFCGGGSRKNAFVNVKLHACLVIKELKFIVLGL